LLTLFVHTFILSFSCIWWGHCWNRHCHTCGSLRIGFAAFVQGEEKGLLFNLSPLFCNLTMFFFVFAKKQSQKQDANKSSKSAASASATESNSNKNGPTGEAGPANPNAQSSASGEVGNRCYRRLRHYDRLKLTRF